MSVSWRQAFLSCSSALAVFHSWWMLPCFLSHFFSKLAVLSCLQLATSPISASYGLQGCSCWSHCLGTFVKCLLALFSWKSSVMKESIIAYQSSNLHPIIVGNIHSLHENQNCLLPRHVFDNSSVSAIPSTSTSFLVLFPYLQYGPSLNSEADPTLSWQFRNTCMHI